MNKNVILLAGAAGAIALLLASQRKADASPIIGPVERDADRITDSYESRGSASPAVGTGAKAPGKKPTILQQASKGTQQAVGVLASGVGAAAGLVGDAFRYLNK